jgi:uncharacterized protein DUF3987
MTSIDRVLAALRSVECEPKQSGNGWTCRCPAHDDRNPSLSIGTGNEGGVLLYCHAGCKTEEVLSAISLTMRDLMPVTNVTVTNTPLQSPQRQVSVTVTPKSPHDVKAFASPEEAITVLNRVMKASHEGKWTYRDENNESCLIVLRYPCGCRGEDDPKPGKTFRPVSRIEMGWIIGDPPGKLPLYNLPEICSSKSGSPIFVAEGEKAADAGIACGILTSTSAHGSKSAKKSDWSAVRGRDVVILPDRDQSGERYAADVAKLANTAGARSVRVVLLWEKWPDLPKGGDLADLLETEGRESIQEGITEMLAAADQEEPPSIPVHLNYQPFPAHALPEPVRSFVVSASEAIGCDSSMVGLPVLAVLASAIGNSRVLVLKDSWSEPAIVWMVVVAESGQAKSPAFTVALGPLRDAQRARMKEVEDDKERYEIAKVKYERECAQWRKSNANTDPPSSPEEPRSVRLIVSDQTIEAVADRLKDNPRGLLLERDELSGWICGFDRYSNGRGGDVSHWLSAWSGQQMLVDRKTGLQTTLIPRATLSVCGTIQPGTLTRIIGTQHQENGLLARMLFAMPPSRRIYWSEATIEPSVAAHYASNVEDLLGLDMLETSDGLEPLKIRLNPAARAAFVSIHDEFVDETKMFTGQLAATASKLRAYLGRLTLIIHLVRCAADDQTVEDSGLADACSVRASRDFVWWFWQEAQRIHGVMNETDAETDVRHLVEWIERRGGVVSVRELSHGLRKYRGDSTRARADLDQLALEGLGKWDLLAPSRKGGRQVERFRLTCNVSRL